MIHQKQGLYYQIRHLASWDVHYSLYYLETLIWLQNMKES